MIDSLNLKKINAQYENELKVACAKVIDSGWYINGNEVSSFEKEFSTYVGVKYCLGVGNGFDALSISLRAWKQLGRLKDGDEIIVQSNTFIASVLAITENNLTPMAQLNRAILIRITVGSIRGILAVYFLPK